MLRKMGLGYKKLKRGKVPFYDKKGIKILKKHVLGALFKINFSKYILPGDVLGPRIFFECHNNVEISKINFGGYC